MQSSTTTRSKTPLTVSSANTAAGGAFTKTCDVELPEISPRSRRGWARGTGEESIRRASSRPDAYTGYEHGLCSICHAEHKTVDHGDLPPGRTAPCLCALCKELFTSITAFNKHKRPSPSFGCYKPERRKLVLVDQGGWFLWANPGSRPEDI